VDGAAEADGDEERGEEDGEEDREKDDGRLISFSPTELSNAGSRMSPAC
jgi:hypothetical protein